MIKNYFKVAIRNMVRNKTYSLINILGLTLGITCSSLLFILVIDELTFDNIHSKKDQIYRVVEIDDSQKETRYYGQTAPAVGPALRADYAEISDVTRIFQFGGHFNFELGDEKFHERQYFYADPNFFNVFDANWIAGDPSTALEKPNSIIIDSEWANRLYGSTENLIGTQLDSGGEEVYEITGVIEKLPQNTHLQYKVLVAVPNSDERIKEYLQSWSSYGAFTYLLFNENATKESFTDKIPDFIAKNFEKEQNRNFYLQAMNDIHFGSQGIEYATDQNRGEMAYVYIFIGIAVFMLLIACINYMNLATAKSLHRGKEIGIRKVSGAIRSQLIGQFLSESIVISMIALILSIGLVDLAMPFFNMLTGKAFELNIETFGETFSLLFILTLIIGLLAGSYPALLLSRLKPANILRGAMTKGTGSIWLRKVLVITQFSLSIIMIVATIVATRQLDYIQNASLGFSNDQIMVVDINSGNVRSRFETIKQEYNKSPYIQSVAVSSRVPGEWKTIRELYARTMDDTDSLRLNFMGFDADMLDLYGMEIAEGQNFTGNPQADSLHILINEKAAEMLGLEDPVGRYLTLTDDTEAGLTASYQIAGVVKNFNFQSLHNTIGPMVLGFRSNPFQSIDYFSLKFDPEHVQEAIADAESVHNQFDTRTPMEYHFLDEEWSKFYQSDQRASNIFTIGAGITLFVACLGLFGLASFIIQKRMKEIGVRKVLGASMADLFVLLSKTFVQQVMIAFVIAIPIAWYAMSLWLDNFAFKFDFGVLEFAIAGLAALAVAVLSVSYKVINAAFLNPVNTLKDE